MSKKKKTLPKNFRELVEAGDIPALKKVFDVCELDAYGEYGKKTALAFYKIPDEFVRWLVAQGADINAVDTYQRTPLHEQVTSWCGNTRLFLELGADMKAADYQHDTPLHMAAASFKPEAVRELVSHGADIHVQNKTGQTPLAKALVRCDNSDIERMAEVADVLLKAGAVISPDMPASVRHIGEKFEFHREGFNKERLEATDVALLRLYELFGVAPVEKRTMYDGVSPIKVSSIGWKAQHQELWSLLVPSSGAARTVQGEVIRITGRVHDEIFRNGGANWDTAYRNMLDALIIHLGSGVTLDTCLLNEAAVLTKNIRQRGDGDNDAARLCEMAVMWVQLNPQPVELEAPKYQR